MTLFIILFLTFNQLAIASNQPAKLNAQMAANRPNAVCATALFERTDGNWEVEDCNAKTVITITLPSGVTLGKTTQLKSWVWAKQAGILQNLDPQKYGAHLPLFALIEENATKRDKRTFCCIPYQSTHSVTRKYAIYDDQSIKITQEK